MLYELLIRNIVTIACFFIGDWKTIILIRDSHTHIHTAVRIDFKGELTARDEEIEVRQNLVCARMHILGECIRKLNLLVIRSIAHLY